MSRAIVVLLGLGAAVLTTMAVGMFTGGFGGGASKPPPPPPPPQGFAPPQTIDGGDGSAFSRALLAGEGSIFAIADDALAMLLHESGLNPVASNPPASSGKPPIAVGIFQALVNQATMTVLGGRYGVAEWKNKTALEQLPEWFAYLRQEGGSHLPLSGRDLYWHNYLPATYVPGAADDYPFVFSDDTYATPDGARHHMAGVYTQNKDLDFGQKGQITAGDMQKGLDAGKAANPKTFAYFANQLAALRSGAIA